MCSTCVAIVCFREQMAGRTCRLLRWRRFLSKSILTTVCLLYAILVLENSSSLLQPRYPAPKQLHDICNTSQPYQDCNPLAGQLTNVPAVTRETDRQVLDPSISELDPSDLQVSELSISDIRKEAVISGSSVYDYKLLINQPQLCAVETDDTDSKSPFLLIIVHSHLLNVARRNAIRQTWARNVLRYHSSLSSQVVFLLGSLDIDHDNSTVLKESALYHDVLQWDFKDAYHNLTLKSILGLRWSNDFCPHARFILKTDDDIYLNISSILGLLQHKREGFYIIGNVNPSSSVMRVGQWGVSIADYPSFTYPPYCSGAAYVISRDAVSKVTRITRFDRKVFPVEDVYVTGILPQKFRHFCSHNPKFPKWETLFKADNIQTFLNDNLYGIHGVSSEKMYTMRRIIHECKECKHNRTAIEDIMHQDEQYFNFYDEVEEGYTDVLK